MIGTPPMLPIDAIYVVYDWGQQFSGWVFKASPSGFVNKTRYSAGSLDQVIPAYGGPMSMVIPIPIDPITAIHLGLVKPEEINVPPGIAAAFHMLK